MSEGYYDYDERRVPDGTGLSSLRDGAASASPPEASIPSRKKPTYEQLLEYVESSASAGCATAISLLSERD